MKDYTQNEEEKEIFILYFDEKEKELMIHYASGTTAPKKNTKANRRRLLNIMERQVKQAKEYQEECEAQQKKNKRTIIGQMIGGGGYVLAIFGLHLKVGYLGVAISCFIIPAIENYKKMQQTQDILEDIEKNEMYLEFSKIREEVSVRMLEEIRTFAKEQGASQEQLEEIPKSIENLDAKININSIDKISYVEMKQMLENAKALRNMPFLLQAEQQNLIAAEGQEEWQGNTPIAEQPYIFQRALKAHQAKEEKNNT